MIRVNVSYSSVSNLSGWYNIRIGYDESTGLVGHVAGKVRVGKFSETVKKMGDSLIALASNDDQELFYVSQAFFIIENNLPYELTEDHFLAIKSTNQRNLKPLEAEDDQPVF